MGNEFNRPGNLTTQRTNNDPPDARGMRDAVRLSQVPPPATFTQRIVYEYAKFK